MTFDKFKAEFVKFLENSNVNLGRKTTKTRQDFLDEASAKLEALRELCVEKKPTKKTKKDNTPKTPMSGSVKCIKPKNSRRGLGVGKGVHAMTKGESELADEQLNRSPFAGKTG